MTDRYKKIRDALAMGPTPGPWVAGKNNMAVNFRFVTDRDGDVIAYCDKSKGEAKANASFIAACDPDIARRLLEERDGLTTENAMLREALHVVSECGDPCKVILYDEEGIEGWRWTHPNGREWTETGEWSKGPPLHPVARAVLGQENRSD